MATTKKAKKALSPAAKRLIQSERRRLARAEASAATATLERARERMYKDARQNREIGRVINSEAIWMSLREAVGAVTTSWGIDCSIQLSQRSTGQVSALTDFKNVYISYPTDKVPMEAGDFNVDELAVFVGAVKALAYHEVGHIRFTVPFAQLMTLAFGSTFLTSTDKSVELLHKAWNALEDQRMERMVVNESPVIAKYLTMVVCDHMLTQSFAEHMMWPLLAGRTYLPQHIRHESRDKFQRQWGVQSTYAVHQIVRQYMAATDPYFMGKAVVDMYDLLSTMGNLPSGPDQHGSTEAKVNNATDRIRSTATEIGDMPQPDKPKTAKSDDKGESESAGGDNGEDSSEDGDVGGSGIDTAINDGIDVKSGTATDADGTGNDGTDADDSDADGSDSPTTSKQPGGSGAGFGNDSKPDITTPDITTPEDIRQQIMDDESIKDIVRDIHRRTHESTSNLRHFKNGVPMDGGGDHALSAEMLAVQVTDVLNVATAELEPIWQARQTRGVLDPFSFRTRMAGSTEYYRRYDDVGDTGIDIAVSILLDTSGSMGGCEHDLGVTAYACKKACENHDIPCTVMVFSDTTEVLWEPQDRAEKLILMTGGGTNPSEGLEDLRNQSHDKSLHLVILMTDGEMNRGFPGFLDYKEDNRYFVGFGFGVYGEHCAERMLGDGVDEAIRINDLAEIPQALSNFLASIIR